MFGIHHSLSDLFRMKLICNHCHSEAMLCIYFLWWCFFPPQESEGGLYVCMNTFLGFGREHVERHYRKTGQSVYMHLKRHVKEVSTMIVLFSTFLWSGFGFYEAVSWVAVVVIFSSLVDKFQSQCISSVQKLIKLNISHEGVDLCMI